MPELFTPQCLDVGLEWTCTEGSVGLSVPFPTDPCRGSKSEQGQVFIYCWACPRASVLRLITTSAPLEFTSLGENTLCRSQCYVLAGSHLCTVQGAVLTQFPLPV